MLKSILIVPHITPCKEQAIDFVLAIGSVRQVCRLQTTFRRQNQALSYFHRYRTEFERVARARLARGDVEDGVIEVTML